ncbi:23764_t:CDS:1 [Entrophospora sp. SA101]|nr:11703_t:CDS:1 [Entrophospora sp. SA101]CAJ0650736.1 7123_t:CDS:1 [Entrophospora sp. SA101]CAJ0752574.1 7009_t:CDS:1 [Entrophospora sp. SA101]CAJ0753581.1 23764_t:CDS:1 [Entrophospora sp. SA101]CAJ0839314.1 14534_t:CDS:1 [Entrophospora sp. SA101]
MENFNINKGIISSGIGAGASLGLYGAFACALAGGCIAPWLDEENKIYDLNWCNNVNLAGNAINFGANAIEAGFIWNNHTRISKLEEELMNRHYCGINRDENSKEFVDNMVNLGILKGRVNALEKEKEDTKTLKVRVDVLEKENNKLKEYIPTTNKRMSNLEEELRLQD